MLVPSCVYFTKTSCLWSMEKMINMSLCWLALSLWKFTVVEFDRTLRFVQLKSIGFDLYPETCYENAQLLWHLLKMKKKSDARIKKLEVQAQTRWVYWPLETVQPRGPWGHRATLGQTGPGRNQEGVSDWKTPGILEPCLNEWLYFCPKEKLV